MMEEKLTLEKMQEMQKVLQAKNIERWGGLSPEKSISKLLWLHGEVAEVGTHDELMRRKGIYFELVMAQRQMSKMG